MSVSFSPQILAQTAPLQPSTSASAAVARFPEQGEWNDIFRKNATLSPEMKKAEQLAWKQVPGMMDAFDDWLDAEEENKKKEVIAKKDDGKKLDEEANAVDNENAGKKEKVIAKKDDGKKLDEEVIAKKDDGKKLDEEVIAVDNENAGKKEKVIAKKDDGKKLDEEVIANINKAVQFDFLGKLATLTSTNESLYREVTELMKAPAIAILTANHADFKALCDQVKSGSITLPLNLAQIAILKKIHGQI